MPSIFDILAEQRIAEAIRRGELDHLPGEGKPLVFDDDPFVTPEQRMLNRILKKAGIAPAEVMLRKEIADLRKEIAGLPDSAKRDALRRELALLLIRLGDKAN